MADLTRREFVKAGTAGAAGIAIGPADALRGFQAPARGNTMRIAVIGAGPAGLTAAYTLRKLGYTNVTVFEKEARPGGKVLTDYSQGTPIEMGAVFATDRYEITLQLAREVGAPTFPMPYADVVFTDDGTVTSITEAAVKKHGAGALQRAIERYNGLVQQYGLHKRRGLAGIPAELHVPFAEFAAQHDIVPLADLVRCKAVGYGYGYYENVPAAYYLAIFGSFTGSSHYYMFPRGYQDLWIRLAARLNVRCSAQVTAVRRRVVSGAPRIEIQVNGKEEVFDRAIVASPPSATVRYLDLTAEERELFARVVSRNYHVTVASVDGIPSDRHMLFSDLSTRPGAAGHVALWYDPAPPRPVYAAYQLVGDGQTEDQARRLLAEDFHTMGGGTVSRILLHHKWDYFAHVETAALRDRFYDRFEGLQGNNGTLFATGLLSLESVEHAARYAQALVKEKFAPASAGVPTLK